MHLLISFDLLLFNVNILAALVELFANLVCFAVYCFQDRANLLAEVLHLRR